MGAFKHILSLYKILNKMKLQIMHDHLYFHFFKNNIMLPQIQTVQSSDSDASDLIWRLYLIYSYNKRDDTIHGD